MQQGMTKRLKPKDKRTTVSWKKRDAARVTKQQEYLARVSAVPAGAFEQEQS